MVEVFVKYNTDNKDDKRRLMEAIDRETTKNQSTLDSDEKATQGQRKYMNSLGIKWDENTSKKEASQLIKNKVGD